MKKLFNTFIILIAIAILSFGGYVYFSHSTTTEADDTDSISSSLGNPAVAGVSGTSSDSQIAHDTAFLATLTSLTVIKIDTTLFANNAFTALKDNQVTIQQIAPGRSNPFASISSNSPTALSIPPQVVTGDATLITGTTATLSGSTKTTATASYFQYGVGTALDKKTAAGTLSLVGTWSTKLTGLVPKTQYSFQAVSKIGGSTVTGDVMTFTTN